MRGITQPGYSPMQFFLSYLLLLPLLACSSLKTRESDDAIKSNDLEDKQPLNIQKVEQSVINPKGVSRNTCLSFIINQAISFHPDARAQLSLTSHAGNEYTIVYRNNLASNFHLKGLSKLPYHTDLKVFENFQFPDTREGKIDALLLVFSLLLDALESVSFYKQLFNVVFEEVANIAQHDEPALEKFFNLCDFKTYFSDQKGSLLVGHLIIADKVEGLFSLAKNWPELKLQICDCFESVKKEDFSKVVSIIANHLTRAPEHFEVFFPKSNSPEGILCLLSSKLPMQVVNEMLKAHNQFPPSSHNYFQLISNVLEFPLNPELLDQKAIRDCLLEHLNFIGFSHLHLCDLCDLDLLKYGIQLMSILTTFRYKYYYFSEMAVKSSKILRDENFRLYFSTILISVGRFDEALLLLPTKPSDHCLEVISDSPSFCSLLARSNPVWVQTHFKSQKNLLFKNLDLLSAFFVNDNMAELLNKVPRQYYEALAVLIFVECSLDVVEKTLSAMKVVDLTQLYYIFIFNAKIPASRFAQIMNIFISLEKNLPQNCGFKCARFHDISPEASISVLELVGLDDYYRTIYCNTLDYEIMWFFHSKIFISCLESPELFSKILPLNKELKKSFDDYEGNFSNFTFTLTAIYNGSRFFELDRVDFVKNSIKSIDWTYRMYGQDFLVYFASLIAVSRAWISADKSVTEYEGVDYCKETLKEIKHPKAAVCLSIYAALSSSGQAALKHVFAEIDLFREEDLEDDLVQYVE